MGRHRNACPFTPLILPEPDAGIRKGLDEVLRSRELPNNLDIALEIGGWATIQACVRDGFGVAVVSEGALADSEGVTLRKLDPRSFVPIMARLIYRRAIGPREDPDLTEPAQAWCDELRKLAREHKPLR